MVQPINYITPNSDIMGKTLQGYGAGLDASGARQDMAQRMAQEERAAELHPLAIAGAELGLEGQRLGLDQTRQTMDIRDAQETRDAEAANREELRSNRNELFRYDLADLARKPDATFDDYFALASKYPEVGATAMETFEALDDNRRRGTAEVLGQIAVALRNDNVDLAISLGEEYAAAAENSDNPEAAQTARAMIELTRVSPEAALASLGVTLVGLDEDIAKQALGGAMTGEGKRVQSSKLFSDGTSFIQFSDGTTEVKDPQGNVAEGEKAQEVLDVANAYETQVTSERAGGRTAATLDAETSGAGSAAAAEAIGKLQAKFVEKAFDGVGNLSSNISNINRAIAALEAGGRAGLIDKYRPALDKATADLRSTMNQMGLDIIGSVTFGALSKGELDLAMDTAVPRSLGETELKAWLEERLEAQEKVHAAMVQQAQFLSKPTNTLEMWAAKIGADVRQDVTNSTPSYLENLD